MHVQYERLQGPRTGGHWVVHNLELDVADVVGGVGGHEISKGSDVSNPSGAAQVQYQGYWR